MSLRRRRILFFSVVKERPVETPPVDGDAITTEAGVELTTEADQPIVLE